MANWFKWLIPLAGLAAASCSPSGGTTPPNPALYTTWGVQPYQMRPDGLLTNGLTPVDPMNHF